MPLVSDPASLDYLQNAGVAYIKSPAENYADCVRQSMTAEHLHAVTERLSDEELKAVCASVNVPVPPFSVRHNVAIVSGALVIATAICALAAYFGARSVRALAQATANGSWHEKALWCGAVSAAASVLSIFLLLHSDSSTPLLCTAGALLASCVVGLVVLSKRNKISPA